MSITYIAEAEFRHNDSWGGGKFNDPRGARKHNGIDFEVPAGSLIMAPVSGVVSKLGYPYGDDLSYRYVQITNSKGDKVRIFYVDPRHHLRMGSTAKKGQTIIGKCQDLTKRYPANEDHDHHMHNHVHLEIVSRLSAADKKIYIDPTNYRFA